MRLGAAIADKIMNDTLDRSKVSEINTQMKDLESLQSRVDSAIASITDPVAKARLEQSKLEARSFFNSYVIPAYMKLYNMATSVQGSVSSSVESAKSWWDDLFSGDFGGNRVEGYHMGALPLLPVAYVTAIGITAFSGTAIYYINQQREREVAILNDPAFTAEQKVKLLEGGSLYGILGQAKWAILAAAAGGIAYVIIKGRSK